LKDLKRVVIECVERAMADVFGSPTKDAVIYYLETKGVSVGDAAERPGKFIEALYEIFGVGVEILERRFVNDIGEAFGIASHGLRLQEIVEKAAQHPQHQHKENSRGGDPQPDP
jgi:hypothetical protein